MKSSWLVAGLAVAVGCGAAVVLLKDRKASYSAGPVRAEAPSERRAVPAPPTAEPAEEAPPEVPAEPPPLPAEQPHAPAAAPPEAAPQAPAPAVAPIPRPAPAADPPAARPAQPKPPKQAQKSGKNSVPPAERPLAREALALVGADPVAETVWFEAINDPTRSTHERKDLIEDLNEEGFDDPKNLTAADLPLIESRLALIEQLAPQSMDDVNFAAFAEAYKDLVNMYSRVAGR
jgi:hypothetical protein